MLESYRTTTSFSNYFISKALELHILAKLPVCLRPPITFAYFTGWRMRSEILPLTWDRVDLEAGTVRLYRGTTKNKDGRIIHLPHVLHEIIDQQWQEHLTHFPDCPFVFHYLEQKGSISGVRGSVPARTRV